MKINTLQILDIKGFEDSSSISFSPSINVITGANNSGKSTLLRCLYRLQSTSAILNKDVRKGKQNGSISIRLGDINQGYNLPINRDASLQLTPDAIAEIAVPSDPTNQQTLTFTAHGTQSRASNLSDQEPTNFIYPFLAKRKVIEYAQTINYNAARSVADNLSNLVAKVDHLKEVEHPSNEAFTRACVEIIGFPISTFPSQNGKQAGLMVNGDEFIPLETMGEGIGHLLGLIVSLCVAHHKLFLIEELENDIHPLALKALLRLIVDKSTDNQFILSTHSNIVTKFLASELSSKLLAVAMTINANRIPTSQIHQVSDDPTERRRILEDLGYELEDYSLWKGYLFLEESSAESIVRDLFIPWFYPALIGKIRTIAAGGISKIEPRFEDFDRLFLFTHLETMYKNRAWIFVDGGDLGRQSIDRLKARYQPSGWHEEQFQHFDREDFELYYPERFSTDATKALALPDKPAKKEAKRLLLNEVLDWAQQSPDVAKSEFSISAEEIIRKLGLIATEIE